MATGGPLSVKVEPSAPCAQLLWTKAPTIFLQSMKARRPYYPRCHRRSSIQTGQCASPVRHESGATSPSRSEDSGAANHDEDPSRDVPREPGLAWPWGYVPLSITPPVCRG